MRRDETNRQTETDKEERRRVAVAKLRECCRVWFTWSHIIRSSHFGVLVGWVVIQQSVLTAFVAVVLGSDQIRSTSPSFSPTAVLYHLCWCCP